MIWFCQIVSYNLNFAIENSIKFYRSRLIIEFMKFNLIFEAMCFKIAACLQGNEPGYLRQKVLQFILKNLFDSFQI